MRTFLLLLVSVPALADELPEVMRWNLEMVAKHPQSAGARRPEPEEKSFGGVRCRYQNTYVSCVQPNGMHYACYLFDRMQADPFRPERRTGTVLCEGKGWVSELRDGQVRSWSQFSFDSQEKTPLIGEGKSFLEACPEAELERALPEMHGQDPEFRLNRSTMPLASYYRFRCLHPDWWRGWPAP